MVGASAVATTSRVAEHPCSVSRIRPAPVVADRRGFQQGEQAADRTDQDGYRDMKRGGAGQR
jgi:hypothetical protein